MSWESRLKRGDNPEDVKKLFPHDVEAIEKSIKKPNAPKKKAPRKSKV